MMSFYEFQRHFPDDEACLRRIMIERYGGTELDCPKCGEFGKFYRMTKERGYVCQHCGHHLHPTVGTPSSRVGVNIPPDPVAKARESSSATRTQPFPFLFFSHDPGASARTLPHRPRNGSRRVCSRRH